jgi:hypothetical protein
MCSILRRAPTASFGDRDHPMIGCRADARPGRLPAATHKTCTRRPRRRSLRRNSDTAPGGSRSCSCSLSKRPGLGETPTIQSVSSALDPGSCIWDVTSDDDDARLVRSRVGGVTFNWRRSWMARPESDMWSTWSLVGGSKGSDPQARKPVAWTRRSGLLAPSLMRPNVSGPGR